MAKATPELIQALKNTATNIEKSADYQWGHMGSCNCGFLAQEITHLRKDEIHKRAMERYGDWNEQLNDYCPSSGLLIDDLITTMLNYGFDSDDLKHLEKLSDKRILLSLPLGERNLKYNCKHDAVKYMRQWAALLEEELLAHIKIPSAEFAFRTEV